MADIAVIIVNYNTASLAVEAIASALAQEGPSVEVHLVDNASPDGDAAALAEIIAARGWGGRVTLYAETVNHGFGRGNNVALAALRGRAERPDLAMFLNPDARLAPGALAALAEALEGAPDAAAAGARITDSAGAPQTAAFRFPGIGGVLEGAVNFGPASRLLARWRIPLPPDQPAGAVDWVSGAAFMARLSALDDVGGFDPIYFLYFEETDMMRALTDRGWRILTAPEAVAVHDEGGATGVAAGRAARRRAPAYWYQSWRRYFHKNRGRAYALAAALAWLAGGAVGAAIARARGRRSHLPAQFFGDVLRLVVTPLATFRGLDA